MSYKYIGYDSLGQNQRILNNPATSLIEYQIYPTTNYNSGVSVYVGLINPPKYNNGVEGVFGNYDPPSKSFIFSRPCTVKVTISIGTNVSTADNSLYVEKNAAIDYFGNQQLNSSEAGMEFIESFVATDYIRIWSSRNGINVNARNDSGSSYLQMEFLSQRT